MVVEGTASCVENPVFVLHIRLSLVGAQRAQAITPKELSCRVVVLAVATSPPHILFPDKTRVFVRLVMWPCGS